MNSKQLFYIVLIVWNLLGLCAIANGNPGEADDIIVEQGKIWVDEKTGTVLPLDTIFYDEKGVEVTIGSLINKPTILLPIYFYCPNSCSTNLANLAVAMNRMKLKAGKDYRAIALSFSDQDTPKDARDSKRNYLKLLDDDFPAREWEFITGSTESITAVLDAIGYSFKPLEDGTFIHPSALVAIAENGTVIKYVYGTFIPGDIEMALVEAERGIPALSVKRLLNFCFNYDPDKNKTFFKAVKISVLLVFMGIVVFFFMKFLRREGTDDMENENP